MSAADHEMIASLQRESADYANKLDEWRARAGEAIRLLHMLDRPDARHPDVAAFLDALDDDPAPAWLDAPTDGPGLYWLRRRGCLPFVVEVHGTFAYGFQKAWLVDELTQSYLGWKWQRVAPPREG